MTIVPDRRLTGSLLLAAWCVACDAFAGDAGGDAGGAPRALANDYTVVYESPDAATVYAYSPGLIELPGGRLIATMDQGGPGVGKLPNGNRGGMVWRGRVYASDDGGRTWQLKTDSPMIHARPFVAGGRLYVLGHQGFLLILWMRAHTGTTNLACIAKAIEGEDGSLTVGLERAPSGEPMLYVPCPGGQMKFHILFDEQTKRFWLLSSQATDSMTDPMKLPDDRYNLPNNERHRLALHFSTNCVDWCFAGIVSDSGHAGRGRHYASMAFSGEDLLVLSRSGDGRAKDAHNGNLITFHRVRQFRKLVY